MDLGPYIDHAPCNMDEWTVYIIYLIIYMDLDYLLYIIYINN